MGNCNKKSTGNREFTLKCPYMLYIKGKFTVLLRIFRKFTGRSLRDLRYIPRKICCREIPRFFFSNHGTFLFMLLMTYDL